MKMQQERHAVAEKWEVSAAGKNSVLSRGIFFILLCELRIYFGQKEVTVERQTKYVLVSFI